MQADSESDFPGNGASDILDGIESAREDLNAEDASVASPDVNVTLEDDTGIEQVEDDDFDDDAIDIHNDEDLARHGLTRIQIEPDEEEFLLDQQGRIYNLQGELVGTMDENQNLEFENWNLLRIWCPFKYSK